MKGFLTKTTTAEEIGIPKNWGAWEQKPVPPNTEFYVQLPFGDPMSTKPEEHWVNRKFRVSVHTWHHPQGKGKKLLISRLDGRKNVLWADKQRIKNELVGGDRYAIEIFPPQDELIDLANIYWLNVYPEGVKPF